MWGCISLCFWPAYLWWLVVLSIFLHIPVDHLYIFFAKMSIQFFCQFFNHQFLKILNWMYSLFILDINPLTEGSPASGICLIVWGIVGVIIIKMKGSKCNALESSWNHLPPALPSPWKNCLPQNQSLVPKRLGITFLTDILFANIFFHSEGCLCILLIVSFTVQKLFSLM